MGLVDDEFSAVISYDIDNGVEEQKDGDIETTMLSEIWEAIPGSLLDLIKSGNENLGMQVRGDSGVPISDEMINFRDTNHKTCLHWAISNESIEWVEFLLSHGVDTNAQDLTGRPTLHLAGLIENTRFINLLLSHNTTIDQVDNEQRTALHWACYIGNQKATEIFIERGLDINTKDEHGLTPLHLACFNGHVNLVEFLLNPIVNRKRFRPADPNSKDTEGRTPLHAACYRAVNDDFEIIIENLLLSNADINSTDIYGRNCLFWGIVGSCRTRSIKLLIECGINLHAQDARGRQVIHYAAYHNRQRAIMLLGEHGIDINCRDFEQQTPLHAAVQWEDLVSLFIRSDVNLQVKNVFGQTPIHAAMMGGHTESFMKLLNALPDFPVQSKDSLGRNLFHYAAWSNAHECISLLVALSFNVSLLDNKQRNVLHFASRRCNFAFIREYLAACPPNIIPELVQQKDIFGATPLHYAAIEGEENLCKLLLSNGSEATAKDNQNRAPIHIAAYYGNLAAFVVLLQEDKSPIEELDNEGLRINHLAALGDSIHAFEMIGTVGGALYKDSEGRSALFYATSSKFAENLIQRGFDVTEIDSRDQTILYEAISMKKIELITWLLTEQEVPVDYCDSNGITPLHVAARSGCVEIINILLNHETLDPNSQDKDGKTPLMYASAAGFISCVKHFCSLPDVRFDQRDYKGRSSLDIAAFFGHLEVAEFLLESYKTKNIAFAKDGRTPLLAAVYSMKSSSKTNLKLLEALLKRFDVNLSDNKGRNALHRAAFFNNTSVIQFLLDNGAKVDISDFVGVTPLMVAASRGASDAILLLLRNDANSSLCDSKKRTVHDHWKRFYRDEPNCPEFPSVKNFDDLSEELNDWVAFEQDSPKDIVNHVKVDMKPAEPNNEEKYLARIKQLESELESLKGRTKLLSEVFSDAQDTIDKNEEQMKASCASYERLLAQKDKKLAEMEKKLEQQQREMEAHSKNQNIIITELREQEEKTNKKIQRQSAELQETKIKCESLTSDLHKQRKVAETGSTQLKETIEKHSDEITILKERFFSALTLSIKTNIFSEYERQNLQCTIHTSFTDIQKDCERKNIMIEHWAEYITKEIKSGILIANKKSESSVDSYYGSRTSKKSFNSRNKRN